MRNVFGRTSPALIGAVALLVAACAPAAPAPTPAPPKPAPTAAPAKPAAPPEVKPAPVAKPEVKPSPVAKPAVKVDTKAVEEFYKGKTVRIIVGFSPGGGYDTYARLIGKHLGNHIPGKPTIIVENMVGAGSLLAANTVYKTAPKDGTVMGHFIGGLNQQKIVIENPAVEFEPLKFNWIGAPTPDTAACAVRKESGFAKLEEALTKELILGGTAPGSTTDDIPKVLVAALGLKIKLVEGYGGTAKVRLAADQGEIHGGCWGWESISVTWKEALEKKEVVLLGQGGAKPHPDLKGVPHFLDVAKTDDAKKLIEAGIVAPGEISRVFTLPPDVPADRVQAMRDAFIATLKSSELLADANKAGLAIDPVPASNIYERIQALEKLSPELKKKLKETVGQ